MNGFAKYLRNINKWETKLFAPRSQIIHSDLSIKNNLRSEKISLTTLRNFILTKITIFRRMDD